VLLLDEPA
jgi:DNA polymerase V